MSHIGYIRLFIGQVVSIRISEAFSPLRVVPKVKG